MKMKNKGRSDYGSKGKTKVVTETKAGNYELPPGAGMNSEPKSKGGKVVTANLKKDQSMGPMSGRSEGQKSKGVVSQADRAGSVKDIPPKSAPSKKWRIPLD